MWAARLMRPSFPYYGAGFGSQRECSSTRTTSADRTEPDDRRPHLRRPHSRGEAWNRDDAQREQFYIVRFGRKDLWEEYPSTTIRCRPNFPTAGSNPLAIDLNKLGGT